MEIRHLKTFLGVANALSFNKAAEHLNYAQSSVSAQIQALEEELGVQLFDRLGRRILLTEAGVRLLDYAEKILQLADETRAELADGKRAARIADRTNSRNLRNLLFAGRDQRVPLPFSKGAASFHNLCSRGATKGPAQGSNGSRVSTCRIYSGSRSHPRKF